MGDASVGEVVGAVDDGSTCQIRLHPSPLQERKQLHIDTQSAQQQQQQQQQQLLTPQHDGKDISQRSPDPKKSSVSPNSRRVLPTPPSPMSLHSPKPDDGDTDSLMKKFRYDTLKKTKKDTKKNQRNSSTFYLINSVHSEPNISTLTASEPSSPCASPKSPKPPPHPSSPLAKKNGESPLAKNKDSPLSKSRDSNLHNLYLKKKTGNKTGSLPSVISEKQVSYRKIVHEGVVWHVCLPPVHSCG